MKTQLKCKTFFERDFPDLYPPHKATILRNELRQRPDFVRRLDERCVLCSRELNFVSSEVEGMSKDIALDKFNSSRNCKINCK